jgi:hypothetical protein
MKELVYQMWDGYMPPGEMAGVVEMGLYATRIGAMHRFEQDAKFFPGLGPCYGRFRPLHDRTFDAYGKILYADCDVWPVEGLEDNPFDKFAGEIGMCTEPLQPYFRRQATHGICTAADEAWAKRVKKMWGVDMPRTEDGLLKVYNSGVQLWSKEGRKKAFERFIPFQLYINAMKDLKLHSLYLSDQHYIHAMVFFAEMDFVELDNDWNRYVHFHPYPEVCDQRTPTTKFVHVQLRGAGAWDRDKLRRIVNQPREQWGEL